MNCKCKNCGIVYPYDDERGYSKELCGPLCDGLSRGKNRRRDQLAALKTAERFITRICEMLYVDPERTELIAQLRVAIAKAEGREG